MKTRKELLNAINNIAAEALLSNQEDIYIQSFMLAKKLENSLFGKGITNTACNCPENYRVPMNMYTNKFLQAT